MKIFDISQEVFTCTVFPGDSQPVRHIAETIKGGSICNLTNISMCTHNGTHVDAPYHFYDDGKTVDQINLEAVIGKCYVTIHDGDVTAADAEAILVRAADLNKESAKRILIGGEATVTPDAARVFAEHRIFLIGNESQTVGPLNAPAEVHYELLGQEIVLLEGIRLGHVEEGVYMLNAAPLNLGRSDGSPCRAVLIKE